MYEGCFGLDRRPFASVPRMDHYFPATAIEGARTTLVRCVQRGEGTGLVIGPTGAGKTLLCLMLAEQFRRTFRVVMLSNGRLSSRRALFQAILYELGQPYRGMDEGEARLAVVDYLLEEEDARGVVLLVDEAHTLPLRLLDEIRLLTNLMRDNQPLVRVVLVGGPALEEHFASPKLDSFSQRLGARCYLELFNRTETETFIQSQINAAGGDGSVLFPKDVCQSVFQATGGVPRLINQLCDHTLVLAYVSGQQELEPANVEEAWADLQQLPTPWSGEPKASTSASGVIEFGSLDESSGTEDRAEEEFAPLLRVASQVGETAEPAQKLQHIERLLAEAGDEFQPVGSIGPEVELYFDGVTHPFQEEFEQEEVVADRYAQLANRPAPTRRASPAPAAAAGGAPSARVLMPSEEEQLREIAVSADALVRAVSREPEEAADAVLDTSETYELDFADSPTVAEPCEECSAVPASVQSADTGRATDLPRESLPFPGVATSRTPEPPQTPKPTPTTGGGSPRRREYRQLFARLRRVD